MRQGDDPRRKSVMPRRGVVGGDAKPFFFGRLEKAWSPAFAGMTWVVG